MINRKSKIRLIQFALLIISGVIVFVTYFNKDRMVDEKIISPVDEQKLKVNSDNNVEDNIFYNIKYSGLDLAGNRYVLTSKEARANEKLSEIVKMKFVNAVFYFKDDTTLFVESDEGVYNNKYFNMVFEKNVKANYENSELFGDKIVYLNSKRILVVSDNVKVNDTRGTILADELLFDLDKKTLNISSYENKINANINLE